MNVRRVCCDGPGCGLWRIPAGWATPTATPRWPQWAQRTVVMTHQARIGIRAACRAWGIRAGDEVLAPAYNCGTEIDALRCSGATVVFYRVDRQAAIDLDDIRRRTTSRTKIIYVTHYFGWQQSLAELVAWCRQRGLLLFEDCALALFSAGLDGPIGTVGDAAFFSFPKTLATPDGGAWTSRASNPLPPQSLTNPPLRRIVRKSLPLVKRRWLQRSARLGSYSWLNRVALHNGVNGNGSHLGTLPRMPVAYYFDENAEPCAASRLTRGLLASVRPDEIIRRRRRNYARLLAAVDGVSNVKPLYPTLPPGVCPLAFPILVDERKQWSGSLSARGIGVFRWWEGYHDGFAWDDFEDARYLKDHLLTLPIHQDMSDADVDYVAQAVRALTAS